MPSTQSQESTSIADDFKCDDCQFKVGAFYAPKTCITCDGTSNYKPINSTN